MGIAGIIGSLTEGTFVTYFAFIAVWRTSYPRTHYGIMFNRRLTCFQEQFPSMMSQAEIDGALAGGASLDPKSFAAICEVIEIAIFKNARGNRGAPAAQP